MSVGVQTSAITDLINTLQKQFPVKDFSMVFERNTYEFAEGWLKDGEEVDGGEALYFDAFTDKSAVAENVNLFEPLSPGVANHLSQGSVPWKHSRTHYTMERREILMRKNSALRVADYFKARRMNAMIEYVNKMEAAAWSTPDANDSTAPYSFKYWITQLASGQNGQGFYGGPASGFSDKGGIVPSADGTTTLTSTGKTMWNNYACGGTDYYTQVDETALRTLKTMLRKLKFKAPWKVEQAHTPQFDKFALKCPLSFLQDYETLIRKNNDNLGSDFEKFAGNTSFMHFPLGWVEDLDSDTTVPVYAINKDAYKVKFLAGDKMHENDPMNSQALPNVFVIETDCTFNLICDNVRAGGGVMNKTA